MRVCDMIEKLQEFPREAWITIEVPQYLDHGYDDSLEITDIKQENFKLVIDDSLRASIEPEYLSSYKPTKYVIIDLTD